MKSMVKLPQIKHLLLQPANLPKGNLYQIKRIDTYARPTKQRNDNFCGTHAPYKMSSSKTIMKDFNVFIAGILLILGLSLCMR